MPDLTVTLDTARYAAVTAEATAQGVTESDIAQASADSQADILLADQLNAWWNGKTLVEKQAIKDA